jgi:SAM-dependent methyltransferase
MNTGQKSNQPTLPADILSILQCPACRRSLEAAPAGLACTGCGRLYPAANGVVSFTDESNYADNFGFEWSYFAQTQLDRREGEESERSFRERTGFTPEDLRGKLVLDVGCGMGRFAEVATRWGARVVGVDLSKAAEVAAQNLSERGDAFFFRTDVFALPFLPESFDFIYSLGVLHHTPDCERAFKSLPRLLKPGGTIAIWLYSGYNKWYRCSDFYRKATPRFPQRFLLNLCRVAVPLYYVHKGLKHIPLVGRIASGALGYLLPVSLHANPEVRVLDTFDWYSPKFQSKHTYEEVFRWFEACDLESLRALEQTVAVRGSKPRRNDLSGIGSQDEVSSYTQSR